MVEISNKAVAVDGAIRRPFHIGHFCRAATEPHRWTTRHVMLASLSILAPLVLIGCAHKQSAAQMEVPAQAKTENRYRWQGEEIDETRAVIIAQDAVRKNDSWIDRAEFGTPHRKSNGSWRVLVWRLPKVPGGHRLILIDAKGNVTAYIRGA